MLGNGLGRGFPGYLSSSSYIARQSILHPPIIPTNMFRTNSRAYYFYKDWESRIIRQLADLFEAAIGAPKLHDARRAPSTYPPVQIICATPPLPQCRDLQDWDSLRPALVCISGHQSCLLWMMEFCSADAGSRGSSLRATERFTLSSGGTTSLETSTSMP